MVVKSSNPIVKPTQGSALSKIHRTPRKSVGPSLKVGQERCDSHEEMGVNRDRKGLLFSAALGWGDDGRRGHSENLQAQLHCLSLPHLPTTHLLSLLHVSPFVPISIKYWNRERVYIFACEIFAYNYSQEVLQRLIPGLAKCTSLHHQSYCFWGNMSREDARGRMRAAQRAKGEQACGRREAGRVRVSLESLCTWWCPGQLWWGSVTISTCTGIRCSSSRLNICSGKEKWLTFFTGHQLCFSSELSKEKM